MGQLDGRVALVTGAGRGFGQAIALALGREGADVAVNYRASAGPAAAVVAELEKLGRKAVAVKADVSREDDVKGLIDAALARFGRLDILVNNAGVMVQSPFLDTPVSRYDEMFAINMTGTMLCSWHALPAMVERRYGRIINLSSQLGHVGSVGRGGFAAYAATKGAVNALTRALAHEFGQHGITVNAIAPGGIETDMSKRVMTEDYRARRLQELPLHRFGSVDDVAHCAVFLAGEPAGYLTGQILHPSGGAVMP
ncbi:MAG: 3-oxoacyl-ACP reductase FabG [Gemmatimonadetes bacterium]|nr:3-oxoacyl-ACP reductase FabG [Candidatus Rokubacteria bacterium]MBI4513630.1 3-oxoacyl-ACP reductase FabG [Gemmatimonadota bacterium]